MTHQCVKHVKCYTQSKLISLKKNDAFTLIELLTTLSILAIILSISIPSLSQSISASRVNSLYRHIFTLIQYTRSTAVTLQQDVIFCPTEDEQNCINNWSKPLIIFIDKNRNKVKDNDETIHKKINLLNPGEKFRWTAFGTSKYIRYISDGSTEYQNGNFTICLKKMKKWYTRQIKIYKSGRARRSHKKEIDSKYCH